MLLSQFHLYDECNSITKSKSDTICFDEGLTTVEIYNTLTDSWIKGMDMQTSRWILSASVVGGKNYSIGGVNGFIAPAYFNPLKIS